MILKNLSFKNFKQYESLDMDFREGLVGIVGKNGSGKSSIFEGVLLCLFGNISLDKNLYKSSWVAKKESVELELIFEIKGRVWRVRRAFRGKAMAPKAALFDQNDEQVATDAKPVTQAITRLLGMDKDAFTKSIFSGQKELGIISNTKGEERKRMVRKMVGLDKLDEIQKIIRRDNNVIKNQMEGQRKLLKSKEDLQVIENQLETLAKKNKSLEKEEKKLADIFSKKNKSYQASKKVFDEKSKVSRQFNELNLQMGKWEKAVESLLENLEKNQKEETRLEVLKKEKMELAPQVQHFLNQKKTAEAMEAERQKWERRKIFLQRKKELEAEARKVEQEILDLKKDFPKDFDIKKAGVEKKEALEKIISQQETYEKEIAELQTEKGTIRGRIEDRKNSVGKIQELGRDATCPTCLQPLVDSYDETLQKLQQEIATYEKTALQKIENSLSKIEGEFLKTKQLRKSIEDEISRLREVFGENNRLEKNSTDISNNKKTVEEELHQIGDIQFDAKAFETLKNELKIFEPQHIHFLKIENEVQRLPIILKAIEEEKERVAKGQKMIVEQKSAIEDLNFSSEKFDAIQKEMDQLEAEKDQAQTELQQHIYEVQKNKNAQRDLQKDLENHQQIEQQIETSQTESFQLEELNGIFQNFKTQILERVRPTISFTASQLFSSITKGRYEGIKVDENFEFQILEDGQYFPISRFSGGEIDLANLCLRIGISRAIAELSGSDEGLSFLGFDEIFGSQDEGRRFEILSALDRLKEQYRQVYIVSHINSIKEHFPEILEVRKTERGSEVHWLQ